MKEQELRYIRHDDIDKSKWDECIEQSANGLIYAYTYYLDHMADNWDALILGDYKAVMPLPWRRKYGFHYLYQPYLTAQLGIFGTDISASIIEVFLNAIPKKFRLWEFSLNGANLFDIPSFPFQQRKNFVLPLRNSYEDLYKVYRENIRRNIKKSRDYGCESKRGISIDNIIEIARHQPGSDEKGLKNFRLLYSELETRGQARAYGIFSSAGELLSSAAFVFSHRRAYYILVGNHPNGRTLGASHALIDAFITDHAGQDLLLDFEGSDLRNLAFFYSSFGAKEELYPAIYMNRLPWYAKIFR